MRGNFLFIRGISLYPDERAGENKTRLATRATLARIVCVVPAQTNTTSKGNINVPASFVASCVTGQRVYLSVLEHEHRTDREKRPMSGHGDIGITGKYFRILYLSIYTSLHSLSLSLSLFYFSPSFSLFQFTIEIISSCDSLL